MRALHHGTGRVERLDDLCRRRTDQAGRQAEEFEAKFANAQMEERLVQRRKFRLVFVPFKDFDGPPPEVRGARRYLRKKAGRFKPSHGWDGSAAMQMASKP